MKKYQLFITVLLDWLQLSLGQMLHGQMLPTWYLHNNKALSQEISYSQFALTGSKKRLWHPGPIVTNCFRMDSFLRYIVYLICHVWFLWHSLLQPFPKSKWNTLGVDWRKGAIKKKLGVKWKIWYQKILMVIIGFGYFPSLYSKQ